MSNGILYGSFEINDIEHNLVGEVDFGCIEGYIKDMVKLTKGNKELFPFIKDRLMKIYPDNQPAGDLKLILKLIEMTEEFHDSMGIREYEGE